MQIRSTKRVILSLLSFSIIIGVLVAGLWPFNFLQGNRISVLPDKHGLSFRYYSIAYCEELLRCDLFGSQECTIELALCSRKESSSSLKQILCFYNPGDRREEVIVAQWISHIVIMTRNYGGDRNKPFKKTGYRYILPIDSTVFLTITSDSRNTAVYLNGSLKRVNTGYTFIPDSLFDNTRLIIGNSPRGTSHWTGDMSLLAMYNTVLDADSVAGHFNEWRGKGTVSVRPTQIINYRFDEVVNSRVKNKASSHYALTIPGKFRVLQKRILEIPWKMMKYRRSTILDVLLNILGFIPFGFFFSLYASEIKPFSKKNIYALTLLTGFGISFLIEILQVYLPSRDSSLPDLVLNVFGTCIGIGLLHFAMLFSGPYKTFGAGKSKV